jgi:TPR repeat protein
MRDTLNLVISLVGTTLAHKSIEYHKLTLKQLGIANDKLDGVSSQQQSVAKGITGLQSTLYSVSDLINDSISYLEKRQDGIATQGVDTFAQQANNADDKDVQRWLALRDLDANFNLGSYYQRTGNLKAAFSYYSKADELGHPDAKLALGNLYLNLEANEEAIRCYEHVLDIHHYNPTAIYNLVLLKRKKMTTHERLNEQEPFMLKIEQRKC